MAAEIRGLTRIRDKERVIAALTSAFIDYPKLTAAFPGKERRAIAVESALRFYVAFAMRYGGAYALNSLCQEAVVIIPSSRRKASKLKYFLAGSYSRRYKNTIWKLSEGEKQTQIEVFSEMEQMETQIKFPSKYIYVNFLGVRPEYQKRGKGRAVMEKVLAYGEKRSLPIVLFTNEPKTVGFYQSMGFKIMGITSSKKFQFINIYLVKLQ
ncbi:GNAT family N-acetyltransferase [Aminipila sp.]|uniref:GNAT family N-acetyltransferase n=1 Tax=Aminipila sp. TaxID=2060095 RepID=UPI00289EB892|nr:GNAT family N-acetyltransferase [Aminipila sp.]